MKKIDKIELFESFKHDCLKDDIKNLENFSFWDIAGSKYDGTVESDQDLKFDGDHTLVAKSIYWILWRNKGIPNFGEYNFDLVDDSYSGDTINTFRTLFGTTEESRQRVLNLLNLNNQEKEEVEEFYKIYQTIGNFYILPKNTIGGLSIKHLSRYPLERFF